MDRTHRILGGLEKSQSLIEIGPSHAPLAPKKGGWNTTIVDHATREGLIDKYKGHGIDLTLLEEVDVIWSGGALSDAFPPNLYGTYDAIIASHVIEHMPDPISFLKSSQILLKPSGRIILAVPDKRYCFDFFKPLTTTSDWLSVHVMNAKTHTRRAAFTHVAYSVNWGQSGLHDIRFVHSLSQAHQSFLAASDLGDGEYADYHAWHFTPSSFELIILESALVTDLDLRVSARSDAIGHEFFAFIERGRNRFDDEGALNRRRLELLKQAMLELRQQTNMLLEAAGSSQ